MKKLLQFRFVLVLIAALSFNAFSYAQLDQIGKFMAAGAEDATTLITPYISPAVNAFGAALGGGWYNTAGTHELGGFDLTFTINAAFSPKENNTFLVDNAQLNYLQLDDPADNVSPTVTGPKEDGPLMVFDLGGFTEPAFIMPQGLNSNMVPTPMIQAGIGLIKGTEVMVRYLPNFKIRGNEIGLWGLGGKHDIKQWIPGLKKVPVLQISLMYGYTKLHTYVNMDIGPESIGAETLPGAGSSDWDNQRLKLVSKSQTANLLVAANLPVVCFYGGVGFVTTKTNLKLEGDYPVVYLDDITPSVMAMTDPIDIEIKNQDGGLTKPRLNAGVRLKLAVITIHFDYSWANYSVLTGGLGVSFR